MKNSHRIFAALLALVALFSSCGGEQRKYVIGVSQCSDDSWRTKLQQELELSTYFNDEVQLVLCSANDDVERQCRQIDSLVSLGVDLLIVSPQQLDNISSTIAHATDKGIPVILFDRKSDVKSYEEGNWKEKSGEDAMEKILRRLEKENPDFTISLVFGGNDRMAVGARSAIERYRSTHPQSALAQQPPVFYLGIDALPTPGGGIEKVRDGILTASAIYPTHGDELMQLALNILNGVPFEKNNDMETSLVTADNAKVLLLQNKEIENQHSYIQRMHTKVGDLLSQFNLQRLFLMFFILLVAVVSALLVVSVRAYRTKQRLYEKLRRKNEELNSEKAIVERQRDELEEQRDQLLDATTKAEDPADEEGPADGLADMPRNEFLEHFMECIDQRFTDPDLTVEDIGHDMCLSRVQLYRRVKAATGKTPVEIIREKRLTHARLLLADGSLSVSEVAYRVGFSAPSYFTKCYKDFYGKSPSEKKK